MSRPQTLPDGVVTFLFTDVEGSTKLLQRDPAAADRALVRHHELVRAAVESNAGTVFETVGDALYVAFASPTGAIEAASAAHAALAHEEWQGIGELKIRIAIHTGAVSRREDHYFGRPLFVAARLMSLAHGGQTLVSAQTAAVVADGLPGRARLTGLGKHRLKDLEERVEVHQLDLTGSSEVFPPLRSLGTSNLPVALTNFIGRADLVRSIADFLAEHRLVTLLGSGGIGKTRLSIEVGSSIADRFADGVWWIPLGDVRDPESVRGAIAGVVGARGSLEAFLAGWDALLIVDNLEHVIDAASELARVVAACPRIRMLVTSREALRVTGERVVQVPPLRLEEGLALVRDRIGQVRSETVVDDDTGAAIWRILDGLPLAIELASARARSIDPQELLARLEHRLTVLVDGPRDAPNRQRTLRGAIAWSYDLLTAEDREAFELLALFDGGWTLDAAEAICSIDLDAISRLVDRSLVHADARRFAMLPTIREFAHELFNKRLDRETLRRAHAEWFCALAEAAERAMSRHASEGDWLDRLAADSANVGAAMRWAVDHGEAEIALRFLSSCWRYWLMRGLATEGRTLGEAAFALPNEVPTAIRVDAGDSLGEIARFQGDLDRAADLKLPAIAHARERGDEKWLAACLHDMTWVEVERGRLPEARAFAVEALTIRRRLGEPTGIGHALGAVGAVARAEGDWRGAIRAFEESRSQLPNSTTAIWASASVSLGDAYAHAGHVSRAARAISEGLAVVRAIDDRVNLVDGLGAVADLASRRDPGVAARFVGASRRQAAIDGIAQAHPGSLEAAETLVRQSLDPAAFDAAITAGATLEPEEAIEEAIAWLSSISAD